MNVIRSVYSKEIADLRDQPGASARAENLDETRTRVAEASRRGAKSGGLRDHQAAAMKEMGIHFAKGGTRSLVVIPPCGEKRQIFAAAIGELGVGGRKIDGRTWFPNTIVLTPSVDSIGAILREIRAARPDLKAIGYMASRKVSDHAGKFIEQGFGLVTVVTYARFRELAKERVVRPGDIDLLVMNEAHEGLSDMRQAEIAPFLGTAVVTAFTGTPAFDDFKSVHRLLGEDSEVYSISARELRNSGEIPPIVNYLMAVQLEGEGPAEGPRVTAQKRKALVDGVLDYLLSDVDPALMKALRERVALFYGADRAHAEMFAREYDKRYRRVPENAFAAMVGYRKEWERATGRRHDPRKSVLRDEVLRHLARNPALADSEFNEAWVPVPVEIRTATDPKDLKKHIEALIERIGSMPTPMEFLDGTQSAARIADVMARVRKGEVRFLSSAQMLDGMEIPNVGVVVNTPTESLLRCLQQGAQVQRNRNTGFVLNPFYRINGKVEDSTRFFYEASNDMEMGEPVEFNPRYFEDVDLAGYETDINEQEETIETEARQAGTGQIVTSGRDASQDYGDDSGARSGIRVENEDVSSAGDGTNALDSPESNAGTETRVAVRTAQKSLSLPLRPVPSRAMPPVAGKSTVPIAVSRLPVAGTLAAASLHTFTRSGVVPAHKPLISRPAPRPTDRRLVPAQRGPEPTQFGRYTTREAKMDAIVRLIKQRDLFRNAKAPDPGYLSKREFCARMAVPSNTSGAVSRVYSDFEESMVQGRDPVYEGIPVDVGVFRNGRMRWIGVSLADADRIGKALGYHPNLPIRTEKWLTVAEIGRRIASSGHPLLVEIFRDLASDWMRTGKAATPHFSMVRGGGRRLFALHEDGLAWFEAEFNRRRPAPIERHEMRLRDACRRLGSGVGPRAEAVWKAAIAAADGKLPVDRTEDVPFRKALDNGREIGAIGEAGLPWLARKLGLRYHGVVAFDPRFHARLDDAIAVMAAEGVAAERLKTAYDRLRQIHSAGSPVLVDGLQVSATFVRGGSGAVMEFALPKDCLSALAREIRIAVPQPAIAEEDEPETMPGMSM